jgi:hypothetical protein
MKIREWITHAEKKLKGDYQFSSVDVNKKAGPVQKKPKSKTGCIMTLVFAALVVIAGISYFINQGDAFDASSELPQVSDPINNYPAANDVPTTAEPATTSLRPAALLPGTWNVSDRVIAGVSAASSGYLAPASWVFYQNGSVMYWENGVSYSGTWSVQDTGSSFTSTVIIPSLNLSGYIYTIDRSNMVLMTTEVLGEVTNYLIRT